MTSRFHVGQMFGGGRPHLAQGACYSSGVIGVITTPML